MKNRTAFDQQLLHTGMLHWRMDAEEADSYESRLRQKPVDRSKLLWDGQDSAPWSQEGDGVLSVTDDRCLSMEAQARAGQWPAGSPEDGDYCAFGELNASLDTKGADWRSYNRLRFRIFPDCPGMHSPMIALQLYNDGEEKIPDRYHREGYHIIHLKNGEWNDCVWEFPSLPRDRVTSLSFLVHRYGKELSMDGTLRFKIKEISLEHTSVTWHTLGWQCDPDTVVYSTEGYWAKGAKQAVTCEKTDSFSLLRAEDSSVAFTGTPLFIQNEKGAFYLWDFSSFEEEGIYYLESGPLRTPAFPLSSHPLYQSVWKVLHFLYCERCGYPVGRGHGTCHGDILAEHSGVKLAYTGGWHDAGDVSQQTLQTAEVVYALLENARRVRETEPALYFRLMEEAVWGLDFVLRMRFGDGYRATSAGIRRWSDGMIGNFDDCAARVHNHAFENFLMSGIEACAARALEELDPPLARKAYAAACEDYRFALKRFEEKGMELPIYFEHSYNSSLSLYWAAASWAASQIYACEKDPAFSEYAVSFGEKLLSCQETGTPGCPMSGFFYREPDHKDIVHFNHQSREHLYMQALTALCRTQPAHPARSSWEHAMSLYAGYLKQIASYAQPYGMLPAGIHKMDEYKNEPLFALMHLESPFQEESPNYERQLKQGIPLGEGHCLRQFPIWFSFRGNTAIHLSEGAAAAILGNYFQDEDLLQISRDQLYWIFGKNPFGQSLIYGAGRNFAQQYGALNGEMVGSIPVGVETRGNEDVPYWPMENNATYKEVWTTSAARWLLLAAELY
ncbi:MAG TPA: glycoside hydrolase family 9 protein [Candidatus Limivivens intestinipullorum]|uniref:Glycoside hydrolase family 9 protein n=1 Tax=Candidatus Limivivens intestinipullorum TaxID=2840858 RepID=A0A9D1ERF0_9FIRM|nr:glycoside hydrolase family 9 protein [Candidatus Limivivens intestinipullorum]